MAYSSFAGRGQSSLVVQKSKFIGIAESVATEADAQQLIETLRSEYPTASAIAWAYIIDSNVQRFHDGGEPSGTAGMPILSVIQKRGLTHSFCAVIRWFGGIKLGAGGLARAFGGCAIDAMDDAGTAYWCETVDCRIRIDYGDLGKVEYKLADYPYQRTDTVFSDAVELCMRVKETEKERMIALFENWTAAKMQVVSVSAPYDYPWEEEK